MGGDTEDSKWFINSKPPLGRTFSGFQPIAAEHAVVQFLIALFLAGIGLIDLALIEILVPFLAVIDDCTTAFRQYPGSLTVCLIFCRISSLMRIPSYWH